MESEINASDSRQSTSLGCSACFVFESIIILMMTCTLLSLSLRGPHCGPSLKARVSGSNLTIKNLSRILDQYRIDEGVFPDPASYEKLIQAFAEETQQPNAFKDMNAGKKYQPKGVSSHKILGSIVGIIILINIWLNYSSLYHGKSTQWQGKFTVLFGLYIGIFCYRYEPPHDYEQIKLPSYSEDAQYYRFAFNENFRVVQGHGMTGVL